MKRTPDYIARRMIPALRALQRDARALARRHARAVRQAHPSHRDSARNLLHYLALRGGDLAGLQQDLAALGLSRLGRAEAHVMGSIEAVLETLCRLAERPPPRSRPAPERTMDIGDGDRLSAHAEALLGRAPARRSARIMVTLPSEAAERPDLVRELIAAGMNLARINCAHDGPDAWRAMAAHVRAAERRLRRPCFIYADLQGPKLRTGPIRPVGRLVEFGPRRNVWGAVVEPARVLLRPRGAPPIEPASAEAVLPVDGGLLERARVGDQLRLLDARGLRRTLTLVDREPEGVVAQAAAHVYLRDGAPCRLRRGDRAIAEGRVGPLPEVVLPLALRVGDPLVVTPEDVPGSPARYDENGALRTPASIPCTLREVFAAVRPGQPIWFDDGKIGGEIRRVFRDRFEVEITHAGPAGSKLRAEKGINLPETALRVPALTEKDRADLRVVAPWADSIGLSFVRQPRDILALVAELRRLRAPHRGIVLKIENRTAVENLPRLLLAAMRCPPVGVMLARGDLAVEVGFERLADLQEEILALCEAAHVPVIWATQVLESMAKKGLPSRAEVSDAAMSGWAECVMLNKGPHIVETVRLLDRLLRRVGAHRVKRRPILRRLALGGLSPAPAPGKRAGRRSAP